jgi:hypothetical protein
VSGLSTLVSEFLEAFHQIVGLGKLIVDCRDCIHDDLGAVQ